MSSKRAFALAIVTITVAAFSVSAPVSAAPPAANKAIDAAKATCATTYERAQEARIKKHLKAAREDLVVCGSATCPAGMQRECIGWLAEVDAATPSVVIHATSRGADTADVRVVVDGSEAAARLDGAAITLDPGPHTFRFEHAGDPAIEEEHVLVEGQRLAPIDVHFGVAGAAGASSSTPMWIALGVGAVGAASFAAFGTAGLIEYESLKSSCSPHCSKGKSNAVKTRFAISDVSLGVALVGGGVGAALFFTRRRASASDKDSALRVDLDLSPVGATSRLSTSF